MLRKDWEFCLKVFPCRAEFCQINSKVDVHLVPDHIEDHGSKQIKRGSFWLECHAIFRHYFNIELVIFQVEWSKDRPLWLMRILNILLKTVHLKYISIASDHPFWTKYNFCVHRKSNNYTLIPYKLYENWNWLSRYGLIKTLLKSNIIINVSQKISTQNFEVKLIKTSPLNFWTSENVISSKILEKESWTKGQYRDDFRNSW